MIEEEKNTVENCEKFTQPEEISALKKYLRAVKDELEERTELGTDNLVMDSGYDGDDISLPTAAETLSLGEGVSSLPNEKESIDVEKLSRLEQVRLRLEGNNIDINSLGDKLDKVENNHSDISLGQELIKVAGNKEIDLGTTLVKKPGGEINESLSDSLERLKSDENLGELPTGNEKLDVSQKDVSLSNVLDKLDANKNPEILDSTIESLDIKETQKVQGLSDILDRIDVPDDDFSRAIKYPGTQDIPGNKDNIGELPEQKEKILNFNDPFKSNLSRTVDILDINKPHVDLSSYLDKITDPQNKTTERLDDNISSIPGSLSEPDIIEDRSSLEFIENPKKPLTLGQRILNTIKGVEKIDDLGGTRLNIQGEIKKVTLESDISSSPLDKNIPKEVELDSINVPIPEKEVNGDDALEEERQSIPFRKFDEEKLTNYRDEIKTNQRLSLEEEKIKVPGDIDEHKLSSEIKERPGKDEPLSELNTSLGDIPGEKSEPRLNKVLDEIPNNRSSISSLEDNLDVSVKLQEKDTRLNDYLEELKVSEVDGLNTKLEKVDVDQDLSIKLEQDLSTLPKNEGGTEQELSSYLEKRGEDLNNENLDLSGILESIPKDGKEDKLSDYLDDIPDADNHSVNTILKDLPSDGHPIKDQDPSADSKTFFNEKGLRDELQSDGHIGIDASGNNFSADFATELQEDGYSIEDQDPNTSSKQFFNEEGLRTNLQEDGLIGIDASGNNFSSDLAEELPADGYSIEDQDPNTSSKIFFNNEGLREELQEDGYSIEDQDPDTSSKQFFNENGLRDELQGDGYSIEDQDPDTSSKQFFNGEGLRTELQEDGYSIEDQDPNASSKLFFNEEGLRTELQSDGYSIEDQDPNTDSKIFFNNGGLREELLDDGYSIEDQDPNSISKQFFNENGLREELQDDGHIGIDASGNNFSADLVTELLDDGYVLEDQDPNTTSKQFFNEEGLRTELQEDGHIGIDASGNNFSADLATELLDDGYVLEDQNPNTTSKQFFNENGLREELQDDGHIGIDASGNNFSADLATELQEDGYVLEDQDPNTTSKQFFNENGLREELQDDGHIGIDASGNNFSADLATELQEDGYVLEDQDPNTESKQFFNESGLREELQDDGHIGIDASGNNFSADLATELLEDGYSIEDQDPNTSSKQFFNEEGLRTELQDDGHIGIDASGNNFSADLATELQEDGYVLEDQDPNTSSKQFFNEEGLRTELQDDGHIGIDASGNNFSADLATELLEDGYSIEDQDPNTDSKIFLNNEGLRTELQGDGHIGIDASGNNFSADLATELLEDGYSIEDQDPNTSSKQFFNSAGLRTELQDDGHIGIDASGNNFSADLATELQEDGYVLEDQDPNTESKQFFNEEGLRTELQEDGHIGIDASGNNFSADLATELQGDGYVLEDQDLNERKEQLNSGNLDQHLAEDGHIGIDASGNNFSADLDVELSEEGKVPSTIGPEKDKIDPLEVDLDEYIRDLKDLSPDVLTERAERTKDYLEEDQNLDTDSKKFLEEKGLRTEFLEDGLVTEDFGNQFDPDSENLPDAVLAVSEDHNTSERRKILEGENANLDQHLSEDGHIGIDASGNNFSADLATELAEDGHIGIDASGNNFSADLATKLAKDGKVVSSVGIEKPNIDSFEVALDTFIRDGNEDAALSSEGKRLSEWLGNRARETKDYTPYTTPGEWEGTTDDVAKYGEIGKDDWRTRLDKYERDLYSDTKDANLILQEALKARAEHDVQKYTKYLMHYAESKNLGRGWSEKLQSALSELAMMDSSTLRGSRLENLEDFIDSLAFGYYTDETKSVVYTSHSEFPRSLEAMINVNSYLRYIADQVRSGYNKLQQKGSFWKVLDNLTGIKEGLSDKILWLLVSTRNAFERDMESNRDRLPGNEGLAAALTKTGSVKEIFKVAAEDILKKLGNDISAYKPDTSKPINRPEDHRDYDIGWYSPQANLNTPEYNARLNSFISKFMPGKTADREARFFHSSNEFKNYFFKLEYLSGTGVRTTFSDLCEMQYSDVPTSGYASTPISFDDVSSLGELKALVQSSPVMSHPAKFTRVNSNSILTRVEGDGHWSLDSNSYWEIVIEPYLGVQNGFQSYLPSIEEINAVNWIQHGVITKFSRWFPVLGFDLTRSKINSKSLGIYGGEINFPNGIEFTNELRLTIADNSYKSFRKYFEKCMFVSVYSSEVHGPEFYGYEKDSGIYKGARNTYSEGFIDIDEEYLIPVSGDSDETSSIGESMKNSSITSGMYRIPSSKMITAVDKTSFCLALYKNITFRIQIYVLTPQYSTVDRYDLLCVLKDMGEERRGEPSEGGGQDLELSFSIVGENPDPQWEDWDKNIQEPEKPTKKMKAKEKEPEKKAGGKTTSKKQNSKKGNKKNTATTKKQEKTKSGDIPQPVKYSGDRSNAVGYGQSNVSMETPHGL